MKTLQYWGTGNFQEHPYTGRIVTWTEKEKQTVDDAIATKLLAANAGFVLDNDESGEVVTSQINSVTGGISGLTMPDGTQTHLVPLSNSSAMQQLCIPGSITVGTNAGNGFISNSQIPAFGKFYGCRLVYLNYDTTAAMTINGAKVSPSPIHATPGNNSGSLSWSGFVTFNGTQAGSVPQAKVGAGGQTIPGVLVSDFVQVTATARTDVVGAPYLLRVATHLNDSSIVPTYNGTYYANFNALSGNPGMKNATYVFAGTLATLTTTGNGTAESGGQQSPTGAIFYYDKPIRSVACFGDSLFQGGGGSVSFNGPLDYMTWASYSAGGDLCGAAYCTTGQKTQDSLAVLSAVIPSLKPTYALIKPLSPNDGLTQANADTAWGYFLHMVEVCRQNNVIPVACTAPMNSGANWNIVSAQNAKMMALPAFVRKIDSAALLTPGGSWVSAYNSGDNTHPSDAGSKAWGELIASTLKI